MNAQFNRVVASVLSASLGLAAMPHAALAQTEWSTAGSTGTVDEVDLQLVDMNNNQAQYVGAANGTLNIRYNIIPTTELTAGGFFDLVSRFQDNGVQSQVELKLKRFNINTGVLTTIATFDSNSYPAAAAFQTRSLNCIVPIFDFSNNNYFIDAILVKSGTAGVPKLGAIQLRNTNFSCIP